MNKNNKGYIHIYTGDGKGKTTAAFGLALRMIMAGKKVYIGQFIKDMKYNETKIEKYFDNITIKQLGKGCFINEPPKEKDILAATNGLNECMKILKSGEYDLVILDELNIALYFNLFTVEEVINILNNRAENVEVVITGRYAPKKLIDVADLVTEMKELRHYYTKGVGCRNGIEK